MRIYSQSLPGLLRAQSHLCVLPGDTPQDGVCSEASDVAVGLQAGEQDIEEPEA